MPRAHNGRTVPDFGCPGLEAGRGAAPPLARVPVAGLRGAAADLVQPDGVGLGALAAAGEAEAPRCVSEKCRLGALLGEALREVAPRAPVLAKGRPRGAGEPTPSAVLLSCEALSSELREKAVEGLEAGDTYTWSRRITAEDVAAFGDLTRDYNPVHYDRRFAEVKGYRGPISHGLLVGAMLCEVGGQWGWLATEMHFNFLRPVYFGDTITATLTIVELDEAGRGRAEVDYVNQDGEPVLSAWLSGRLPLEAEKQVLRQMLAEGDPTNKLR